MRPGRASPFPPLPHPASAADVSRRLRAWFRRHGRDLPWRRTRDPYRVLVSELMLQQTQVARVVDFYERFLERFPSLKVLAAARPRRVMESWRGLGYYARARNLHALARTLQYDGDGRIPESVDALRQLPGVGAYTAGAVASFAYEQSAPLVDTNVARVLARLFAPKLRPKRATDHAQLWRIAGAIVPKSGKAAWAHNQALMELGALICTARVMHCDRCPVRAQCLSAPADDAVRPAMTRRQKPDGAASDGKGRRVAQRDPTPQKIR